MEKKKRYLLYWAVVCLLVFIIGAVIPRSEMRSLGLEGANQANLKNATEELTEGKTLTFTVAPLDCCTTVQSEMSVFEKSLLYNTYSVSEAFLTTRYTVRLLPEEEAISLYTPVAVGVTVPLVMVSFSELHVISAAEVAVPYENSTE